MTLVHVTCYTYFVSITFWLLFLLIIEHSFLCFFKKISLLFTFTQCFVDENPGKLDMLVFHFD